MGAKKSLMLMGNFARRRKPTAEYGICFSARSTRVDWRQKPRTVPWIVDITRIIPRILLSDLAMGVRPTGVSGAESEMLSLESWSLSIPENLV